MKRSWAVMAVLLTSSACDLLLFPQPYGGPPLPEEGRLGWVSTRLDTPACPNATVFTGVSVIFENLGPCEQRRVDLYAMHASGPYETDLSLEEKPALGFVAEASLLRVGGETSPPINLSVACCQIACRRQAARPSSRSPPTSCSPHAAAPA
jgi:hypothetical protein